PSATIKKALDQSALLGPLIESSSACYFAAGLAAAAPLGGLASSRLRASSARFCNSSCSFFWVSSNTFGSVGGPSYALAKLPPASCSGNGSVSGAPLELI